jgi:transcriptional regulator with XRE-family HTH domain
MDWKKELGIQLREGRDDLTLRQEDLSGRAGIHLNMVGRYERGESGPELDILVQLAKALDKWEFHIGDYIVTIRQANRVPDVTQPRQLRLEYGREYIFVHGSTPKLPSGKETLLIVPAQRSNGS